MPPKGQNRVGDGMKKQREVLAWHFLQADMRANSGHESPWEIGEKRTIEDPSEIALCRYGYHSSPTPLDALKYARGPVLCRVRCSSPVDSDGDEKRFDRKSVHASRTLVASANIEGSLRLFAIDCGEQVLPLFEKLRPGDDRPRRCIETARRFVEGKADRKELQAARNAAYAAALSGGHAYAYAYSYAAAAAASVTTAYADAFAADAFAAAALAADALAADAYSYARCVTTAYADAFAANASAADAYAAAVADAAARYKRRATAYASARQWQSERLIELLKHHHPNLFPRGGVV